MLVRIIKRYRDIVAVCDSDLIGKKFEDNMFQLDLQGEFFKGKETSEERTVKIMQNMSKEDATFNIVGKKSVNTALKTGIISQNEIKKIQGIPFSLVLI